MNKILNQLFNHERLSAEQARQVLVNIANGEYNESQIAAFMTVYLMRNISVEELSGFRSALLELCVPVNMEGKKSIDVCGTGGDGKNTFNISTSSAFVIAGAGYAVTKHGNYGVSSLCGSSNVLEYLGYKFHNNVDALKKQLDACNICFMHAPLFHPAMKSVAPIRRQLGVKTFFNMLGPLVNPARPTHQMVGVFNLQLARIYKYLMESSNTEFAIVHATDGYDEISLTNRVKLISNTEDRLLQATDFNKTALKPEEIFGGESIEEAAQIMTRILNGEATKAQQDVVECNAAVAIQCFDRSKSIEECIEEARISIQSGKAFDVFKKSIEMTKSVA